MPTNYTTIVNQVANMMPKAVTDPDFVTMLPGMIDYAEQRLYRELDLLYTQVTDSTATVSSGNRNFNIPTAVSSYGTFITVDQINIITPVGQPATNGTRVQLTPVSREFLDITYPSGQAVTATPQFYAMASNTQVILGPSPDAGYVVEVVGIQRPAPLSASNSSTILTNYVPDLFFAASMVFAAGFMRDFGSQSDNPQMAQSWEAQYKSLMQSAAVEQARAKFQSEGWTSDSPSPVASPKRV